MKNNTLTLPAVVTFVIALPFVAPTSEAQNRPATAGLVPRVLERPHLANTPDPDLTPGATITAYELEWSRRDSGDLVKRIHGALAVILDESAAARIAKSGALDSFVKEREVGTWSSLGHTPILAKYESEVDEIRLRHEELSAIYRPANDVGEATAQKLAEKYLERLIDSGVVERKLYDEAAMQIGYKVAGEGAVGQKVEAGQIVEYRITYRPRINGIELANAGLRMGILASGELANLRVGGVSPTGTWSGGTLQSSVRDSKRTIRLGTGELMKRFYNQVPQGAEAQLAWSRVMYAMPEGKANAVVEPMLLVSYSESRGVGKERVASRRKTLGFSLTDPDAPIVDFDPPAPKHEGVQQTRPTYTEGQSK